MFSTKTHFYVVAVTIIAVAGIAQGHEISCESKACTPHEYSECLSTTSGKKCFWKGGEQKMRNAPKEEFKQFHLDVDKCRHLFRTVSADTGECPKCCKSLFDGVAPFKTVSKYKLLSTDGRVVSEGTEYHRCECYVAASKEVEIF